MTLLIMMKFISSIQFHSVPFVPVLTPKRSEAFRHQRQRLAERAARHPWCRGGEAPRAGHCGGQRRCGHGAKGLGNIRGKMAMRYGKKNGN